MGEHTIYYTLTKRTRRAVTIEAESEEEALRLVEGYEFDDDEGEEVNSLEWSVTDASTDMD